MWFDGKSQIMNKENVGPFRTYLLQIASKNRRHQKAGHDFGVMSPPECSFRMNENRTYAMYTAPGHHQFRKRALHYDHAMTRCAVQDTMPHARHDLLMES